MATLAVAAAPTPIAIGREHASVAATAQRDVPVTSINLQHERANNSPVLAVDPVDRRFVGMASRVDGPTFGCALHVSGDGGRGWIPVEPVPSLPEGTERCYAPDVSFDSDGTLYYLFSGLHGSGNAPKGVYLTISRDRGQTFSAPLQVLGSHRYMARMAIDTGHRNRLHLVWVEATAEPALGGFAPVANPIRSAYSDDGGRTFSPAVQVNQPGRARVVGPTIVLGPDRAVHVAYWDLGDDAVDYQGLEGPAWPGTWSVVVSSSEDGGGSFDRHHVIDGDVVPPQRVMLVFTTPPPALVAGRSGTLLAAWTDNRHGDWDVLFRRSTDGGRSWTGASPISGDRGSRGSHQYLPQLSVAPDGRVDALFYDRRDDPGNVRHHAYFATAPDGTLEFSPPVRLTSEPSDSRTGAKYPIPSARGLVEMGSRLALVSAEHSALGAWTDTRLPFPGLLHQDIFATEVEFAPDGGESPAAGTKIPWTLWVGVGVLCLAAGGWALKRRVFLSGRRDGIMASVCPPARWGWVVLLAGGVTVSCRATHAPARALPPSPPVVAVTMADYRFAAADRVERGRVVFDVRNSGHFPHELVLVAMPDDFPSSIDVQVTQSQTQAAFPTLVHLSARPPGALANFAMDLGPGRYAMICFVKDADGHQHARKGMSREFRVV